MAPMWSAPKPHCHYMQNHRVNFCQHHLLADLSRLRSITLPSDPSDSWQGQPPKCGHLELPGDTIGVSPKNRTSKTLGTSWHNKVPGGSDCIRTSELCDWLRFANVVHACSCMFMHVHAWPSLRYSPGYGSKIDHQSPLHRFTQRASTRSLFSVFKSSSLRCLGQMAVLLSQLY